MLLLFAIPNLVGWRLWAARDRLSPPKAMQRLVLVAGTSGLAAVYVLDRSGDWETIQVGGRASAAATQAIILAVMAGVLARLHLVSRQR